MALTRKSLKAMGLTEEQVDSIIEAHTETVEGLKSELKTAKEKADKLDDVQKQLDKAQANNGDDYKSKYEQEKKAFKEYKDEIEAEKTKATKNAMAKSYFESKGIKGENLEIALRGARDEIEAIEIDGDKIKDTAKLDELINGTFKGLVSVEGTEGAKVPKPASNTPKGNILTKEEIYKKDEHGKYVMDATERQKALVEMMQKGN